MTATAEQLQVLYVIVSLVLQRLNVVDLVFVSRSDLFATAVASTIIVREKLSFLTWREALALNPAEWCHHGLEGPELIDQTYPDRQSQSGQG